MKKADLVRLHEQYAREWLSADAERQEEIVGELGLFTPHEAAFVSAGVMLELRSAARSASTEEARSEVNDRMLRWVTLCGSAVEKDDH
jgi:hypothetical protein